MTQSVISEQTTRNPETLEKQGIPGQNKEKQNYDKSTFHLPRHSSFMIMHTFADWGRVRHNRAESLGITTVSTTKAHGRIGVNAKVWGEILSSNELLTGNVIELVTMKMRKKYKNYCNFSEF